MVWFHSLSVILKTMNLYEYPLSGYTYSSNVLSKNLCYVFEDEKILWIKEKEIREKPSSYFVFL